MSQNYSISLNLNNTTHGITFPINRQFTTEENASINGELLIVGTADMTVPVGEVVLPRTIILQNKSEGTLLVGYDGTNYDLQLVQNESALLPLRTNDVIEVSQVTTTADTAGSLSADYFDMEDVDGDVRVWIDVDDGSTPPSTPAGGRLVEVDIEEDATNVQVAAAIVLAFQNDPSLTATNVSNVVRITDKFPGARADIADGASATGFTFSTLVQGADYRDVHIKSTSGQLTVAIAVIPT
jgi:hypothetical protein